MNNTRWPEIGSTTELMRAQNSDLSLVCELMRERARLEQEFVNGLRALVQKHKPRAEGENRQYSKVLIDAFEQEIEVRSGPNPNMPEHIALEEKELSVCSELAQVLYNAHATHDDKYTRLLASTGELKEWWNKQWHQKSPEGMRMPFVELEYRLSVHHQRTSARNLKGWYEVKLPPLVESLHSALEDTKAIMINTINTIIDRASTCSRIYSRALGRASDLLPLNYRASIQGKMDLELVSEALVPVAYYNHFFEGRSLPLHFGTGTLSLTFPAPYSLREPDPQELLQAERSNDFTWVSSEAVTLFEIVQYGPLLPFNSREFQLFKTITGNRKSISLVFFTVN